MRKFRQLTNLIKVMKSETGRKLQPEDAARLRNEIEIRNRDIEDMKKEEEKTRAQLENQTAYLHIPGATNTSDVSALDNPFAVDQLKKDAAISNYVKQINRQNREINTLRRQSERAIQLMNRPQELAELRELLQRVEAKPSEMQNLPPVKQWDLTVLSSYPELVDQTRAETLQARLDKQMAELQLLQEQSRLSNEHAESEKEQVEAQHRADLSDLERRKDAEKEELERAHEEEKKNLQEQRASELNAAEMRRQAEVRAERQQNMQLQAQLKDALSAKFYSEVSHASEAEVRRRELLADAAAEHRRMSNVARVAQAVLSTNDPATRARLLQTENASNETEAARLGRLARGATMHEAHASDRKAAAEREAIL